MYEARIALSLTGKAKKLILALSGAIISTCQVSILEALSLRLAQTVIEWLTAAICLLVLQSLVSCVKESRVGAKAEVR